MGIVQQASGTFTATGFSPTLPGASNAANTVILIIAGNTTVTTPTNWTLRTSQVNEMGHYWYDRAAVSLTSVTVASAAGQGTWWIVEVDGIHDISTSANNISAGTTYNTPNLTPTAGDRTILASIGSLILGGAARTVSGWTNSFIEQIDVCQATADAPMQGGAALSVTANGSTAYSTAATYSASSTGRSALIGAYTVAAPPPPPSDPPLFVRPLTSGRRWR